ncbi:YkvA family protein [Demequina iriomotensis]|uniref:YkvA family protein n=1 Tax=Demequina iriomotensis TaxID=1536641 RepID=UPI0007865A3E|nr:YkvA family protein [Demequina iriomotensis]
MWWSFFQAVRRGEHRLAPTTWIAAAGALVYSLWPLDVIPDLLLPFGIVDDLGLWAVTLTLVNRERRRFEEASRHEVVDVEGTVRPS